MRSRPTWEPFSKNRRTVIMSARSEEHTSELQSQSNLVCRLLLEKKKKMESLQIPYTQPYSKHTSPIYLCRYISIQSLKCRSQSEPMQPAQRDESICEYTRTISSV